MTDAKQEAPAEAGDLWPIGSWLSAALDDPKVCDEMKADIRQWFDGGGHIRAQPPAREDAQPVARVSRKGNATGSLVWTDHGRASDLPDDAALFSALIIEGRSKLKREIYDNLCAADNQDLPLEDYPDRILSVVERYIHPAPDALRAAVAKLEKAKITDDPAEVFMLAMEALAALQAEGAN